MTAGPLASLFRAAARWLDPERLTVYSWMLPAIFLGGWGFSQSLGPGPLDAVGQMLLPDWICFAGGAAAWRAGEGVAVYTTEVAVAWQTRVAGAAGQPIAYVSPPVAFPLYAAFAAFGPWVGALLWTAAQLAAYGWMATRLAPVTGHGTGRWFWLIVRLYPVVLGLAYGQSAGFVAALTTAWMLAVRDERPVLAGVAVGLLAFKPQLALPAFAFFLGLRWWRAIAVAGALHLAALCIGELLCPGGTRAFLEGLGRFSALLAQPDVFPVYLGANAFSLVSMLFGKVVDIRGVSPALSVLGLAVAAVLAARSGSGRSRDLALAGATLVGFTTSGHLMVYDLASWIPAFALLHIHLPADDRGRPLGGGPWLVGAVALYLATLVGPQASAGLQALVARFALFGAPNLLPLFTIAVAVAFLRLALHASDGGRERTGSASA